MKDHINNLPLTKKVFLFSFFISLILVFLTAGISVIIQTKQMEEQMRYRVGEMSLLWSTSFDSAEITELNIHRNLNNPSYKNITDKLSIVNEKARYTSALLFATDVTAEGEIFILASSKSYKKIGLMPLSYYHASKEYLKGFNQALSGKKVTTTKMYRDKYGPWITSFVPIYEEDGKVAGILSFDINAELITHYQKNISVYLIGIFIVMTIIGYLILRRGIKMFLSPVNEIIAGLNEVSKGNFNIKLKFGHQNDLGILAERFNNMTSQLSLLFDRLSATSEQLGTIHKNAVSMHRFEEAIDEMEQILQKTKIQRELQRAEKMNAIGQLAASVAHEIRNPMTVVKGFLQIFLAKEQMSEEERMYIRLMIEEMSRAETIINDYLSLAKPDIELMEKLNAAEIASKVLDLMNSYAMMSKNILVIPNLNEDVYIKGNVSELKQVLINILKNGIEAMKDGGTLRIDVYKEANYGVFQISDSGIGMTPEELERLGTAFYSLKEKGTGIGMMVCYQIIERMKGRIEVQSENGVGTTFKIFVPLSETDTELNEGLM
ncbi:ATP-binding protein [Bacillus sp. S/N-304-OC-R1]|uniref:ATP-binding protein n=1 Tax=Bacillus sp. S/N-304-OC-R1 TaxID=2758034 RepID=UPI001C8D49D6|nr:ATP-binding protein [Bacillus sp. S/N-304-OC-R1]MBY0122713.1 two-component sensor histidine kinase [Bacillus sp. S/N-304-OC-R1]